MAGDWDGRRPGRGAGGVRRAAVARWCRGRCSGCAASYEPLQPRMRAEHARRRRARNIARHYDLSNELFALFLDETMTYSCAVFEPGDYAGRRRSGASTTPCCDLAGVGAGDHVLEIGTGWGGMAMHAAATRGCRVTIDHDLPASSRSWPSGASRAAGLERPGRGAARDYRELARAASTRSSRSRCSRRWARSTGPTFFAACDRLLAPGGRMALQTITMPARPLPWPPRRSYTLDPQVHLPGRPDPVGARRSTRRSSAARGCG